MQIMKKRLNKDLFAKVNKNESQFSIKAKIDENYDKKMTIEE